MANILTPEWKIEIGTNTYEMQAVSRISHTTIVLDETGVFTLVIDNAAGIRKSAFTPYDEVKISHKYEEDTAYTQIIGGHVDTQEYTVTDSGDIITLTGRSYEAQFFFKQVYKTWMFEHWATIIEDIVTEVNVNVTDNFTTSLPAAVEQTTGGTDTVDIDDLYNGTEVVGQVIKPNEGYLSTVVVKGYKSSGTVDDLECRVYRCKDNGGTDTNTLANVDWAQTIGGTLLGISTVPPGIITDDSDNPQEISFQVDTPSLDTDNLYMLVFAKATTDDGTGYYLRYNTSGGYADGDYFADGTRITDDDIYFKLNALCVKAEDRTAFDLMREVCGTVLRDWYSTTAKVVTTVERYGTSVKTFTVGKDIISCSIKTDIIPLVNKIVVAGIPKTSNIPTDRDEWTESTTDWEVAYDEESGNTDITTAYPIRKIGEECITIERGINYEANSVCRVEYPDDADEWALADGLDQRVKALSFYASAYQDGLADATLMRFNIRLDMSSGQDFYKDVYVWVLPSPDPFEDESGKDFQLYTLKLPSPGNRRKWKDDTSDDDGVLITWDDADWYNQDIYIKKISIYMYANNDGVLDGEIEYLNLDGLHFILEDDNRIEINETDSQGVFDIREYIIRDEALDNMQSTEAKVNLIKRLRGDGTQTWSGTPGDTRDIQLTANVTVVGNTDVIAGNTINIVYANANYDMDFRVHSVTHEIAKETGWRTTYELAMLLPQLTMQRLLGQQMQQTKGAENRRQFAASSKQQLNVSTTTEETEW